MLIIFFSYLDDLHRMCRVFIALLEENCNQCCLSGGMPKAHTGFRLELSHHHLQKVAVPVIPTF